MAISFGFGGGKSSSSGSFSGVDNTNTDTTFNQNGTQTSTPTNPDWVTNGASSLWNGAQQLGAANPQSYVAGPDGLQTNAAAGAWGLQNNPTGYQTGTDYATALINQGKAPQTSAAQASPYISQYMNPYMNDVVGATMNDFDANAGQTRAQQSLDLARSGAFGGSGAAITQSLTEGQLARARATQDSTLRAQGFDTALGAAQQDAGRAQSTNDLNAQLHGQMQDRRLTAGNDLANYATAQGANERANIATQSATGDQLRQISQQQATAPLDLQSWMGQYYAGLPTQLFHGQTDVTNQSGTQNEVGTETQSGTQQSKGKNSSFNFGFKGQ